MDSDKLDLVYNLLCDLKKKDIDKWVKARLIREYMESKNLSIRQLARKIGVNKSSIEDWIRWEKIGKKEYEGYIKEGFTHTDIYESLREGTLGDKAKQQNTISEKHNSLDLIRKDLAIDRALKRCVNIIGVFKIKPPYSNETKKLINQLRKILDIIEEQIKG